MRTKIEIITSECAGLSATCYIEDTVEALEKAKAEFIAWDEPNSYFSATRIVKKPFSRRWKAAERLATMEKDWNCKVFVY